MLRFIPVAAALLLSATAAVSPAAAEWHRATRSPDSLLVFTLAIAPPAEDRASRRDSTDASRTPTLAIECSGGETRVIVYWREPMAGYYHQSVRLTFDRGAAAVERWRLSTDQDSMGHWGGPARALARRIARARSLTVRAISRRGAALEATFDVAGLARAAAPLARACKW